MLQDAKDTATWTLDKQCEHKQCCILIGVKERALLGIDYKEGRSDQTEVYHPMLKYTTITPAQREKEVQAETPP